MDAKQILLDSHHVVGSLRAVWRGHMVRDCSRLAGERDSIGLPACCCEKGSSRGFVPVGRAQPKHRHGRRDCGAEISRRVSSILPISGCQQSTLLRLSGRREMVPPQVSYSFTLALCDCGWPPGRPLSVMEREPQFRSPSNFAAHLCNCYKVLYLFSTHRVHYFHSSRTPAPR
jgi:hypothetical protein